MRCPEPGQKERPVESDRYDAGGNPDGDGDRSQPKNHWPDGAASQHRIHHGRLEARTWTEVGSDARGEADSKTGGDQLAQVIPRVGDYGEYTDNAADEEQQQAAEWKAQATSAG